MTKIATIHIYGKDIYRSSPLGPVARLDAHPPGIQTVAGLILESGKTFFYGDWS